MSQLRAYEFVTGIEASPQPDAGTPVNPNDLVTLGYISGAFSGKRKIVDSYASPGAVFAGTSIDPTIESGIDEYLQFLNGTGGIDMSANPQVAAPGRAGIRLTLVVKGASSADFVLFENGTGLALNGDCELRDKDSLTLISIDASTWQEEARS